MSTLPRAIAVATPSWLFLRREVSITLDARFRRRQAAFSVQRPGARRPTISINRTREGCTIATLYALKPRFQQLLRPLVSWLAAHSVTANQVTLLAALASIALGVTLAGSESVRWYLLLPLFLFVRMALNAIDGMLAREHGQQSRLGAILNETGDVVSDSALYLPFALVPGASGWLVVVVVLLAALTEMTGVTAQTLGASRRYDGPLGKSDRALVFGALGLLLGFGVSLAAVLDIVLAVVALLLVVTCVNRARRALAEIGS